MISWDPSVFIDIRWTFSAAASVDRVWLIVVSVTMAPMHTKSLPGASRLATTETSADPTPNRSALASTIRFGVSTRRRWELPVVAAAVAIVSWLMASQSFFFADDFVLAEWFQVHSLGRDTLFRSWFGHLMPGYILTDGLFIRAFGMSWILASIVIALVHTGAFVAVVRCIDATVGRARLNLLFGLGFTLSVGIFATRLWWAASLNNMMALALGLAMLGSLTRWVTRRRPLFLVGALVAFALAVSFSEKSLLFAVYGVLWCVLVVWRERPWRERLWSLLRAWPIWLGIALLGLVDAIVFVVGSYIAESGSPPGVANAILFTVWSIVGGFIPSIFGLDLYTLDPSWNALAVIGSCAVIVVIAVVTLLRRRSVAGVWIFIGVVVLVNTLVLTARTGLLGLRGATILRYHLEATALFWLALGVIAFTVLTSPQGAHTRARIARSWPRGIRRLISVSLVVLVVVSIGLWTTSVGANVTASNGPRARAWADNAIASLPDDVHVLRTPVAQDLVLSQMYPDNMTDVVLPLLVPGVTVSDELGGAWFMDLDGTARRAAFLPATPAVFVDECTTGGGIFVDDVAAAPGTYLHVLYHDAEPGRVTFGFSGGSIASVVPAGSGELVVYLPHAIDPGSLTIASDGQKFCVYSVNTGEIVAAP
jgi:hypothetical protein